MRTNNPIYATESDFHGSLYFRQSEEDEDTKIRESENIDSIRHGVRRLRGYFEHLRLVGVNIPTDHFSNTAEQNWCDLLNGIDDSCVLLMSIIDKMLQQEFWDDDIQASTDSVDRTKLGGVQRTAAKL
jgi:hypothetical protein